MNPLTPVTLGQRNTLNNILVKIKQKKVGYSFKQEHQFSKKE